MMSFQEQSDFRDKFMKAQDNAMAVWREERGLSVKESLMLHSYEVEANPETMKKYRECFCTGYTMAPKQIENEGLHVGLIAFSFRLFP